LPWHESNLLLPRSKIATLLCPSLSIGSNQIRGFPVARLRRFFTIPFTHKLRFFRASIRGMRFAQWEPMLRKIVWLATLDLGPALPQSDHSKLRGLVLCAEIRGKPALPRGIAESGKMDCHKQELLKGVIKIL